MDYFIAIMLYFASLGAGNFGFLPADSPIAPPGPEYNPRPAIRASACGPSYVIPGGE